MKKATCIILMITLCLNLSFPVFATQAISDETSITVSDTVRIDVKTFSSPAGSTRSATSSNTNFEIRQYNDDELMQIVTGSFGGAHLIVTEYENNEIVSQETILVSSRVNHHSTLFTWTESIGQPYSIAAASSLGYMICNYSEVLDEGVIFHVYSELTDTRTDDYVVNGYVGDTISVLAASLGAYLGSFIPATSLIALVEIVAVGKGVEIVGGAIADLLTIEVEVIESYYDLYARNLSLGTYSDSFEGVARRVTEAGDYYDEWYYEGFTPYNWESESLGYVFWYQFYDYSFPGIERYV